MSAPSWEQLPIEGRLVALDLGEVRVGVAVCDPGQVVASPVETLHVPRGQDGPLLDALVDVVGRHDAAGIVVGHPRRLDGTEGPVAVRARTLSVALGERTGLPVALVDERFTTVEAERVLLEGDVSRSGRKATVDRVAASVLLQTVLEGQRRRRGGQRATS